jgi:transposase InsO family protein
MASGGLRQQNHRAVLASRAGGYPASVSVRILGFHSDNGSEYINHQMAEMLEKLLAEFTNRGPTAARTTPWWKARTGR